jgi:hypothetical protein
MPNEVSLVVIVAWKGKEEWRSIESMFLAKLCKLLGCGLFTKNRNCGVTGNEFDQDSDQRNYGPGN